RPDERFWVAMIGCLLLGATYSNYLGYTHIDLKSLRDFLLSNLERLRKSRHGQVTDITNVTNVVNIIGRFLNEKRARNTLKTNVIYRGTGKPAPSAVSIVGDWQRLETIMVHIGVDDKVLR